MTAEIICYFINLDQSENRCLSFAGKADYHGLETRRVSAIEGAGISVDERARLSARSSGRYLLGNGELGCFLSHLQTWGEIANGSREWAFVAEDDIHFCASASPFFKDKSWIPSDADIVKAETHRQKTEVAAVPTSRAYGHDLRRLYSNHRGSAGYFISKSAAKRLLDWTETLCDPLDELLFNPKLGVTGRLTIYQMDPAICIQDFLLKTGEGREGLESTIETDREKNAPLDPRRRKKRGIGKIKHEAGRIAGKVWQLIQILRGRQQFKVIPCKIEDVQ